MGIVKMKASVQPVKLSKTYKLHFKSRNEDEEIVKSSNNRVDGMIKTYSAVAKKFKEYSVEMIMRWIDAGDVIVKKPEPKTKAE